MTIGILFDDATDLTLDLQSLVGVDRFGDLVYRRRSRIDAMQDLARRTRSTLDHVTSAKDRADLIARLRGEDIERIYLVAPSHIVPTCSPESLATFVRQAQYSPTELFLPLEGGHDRRGWYVMRSSLLAKYLAWRNRDDVAGFFEQSAHLFAEARDRLGLIDISEKQALLNFLSGQFDVRHFNAIEHDDYMIVKRSKDRAKLKREFDFYRLAPPVMQMFLVQPFDFKDDGETASYRMERLTTPDVALQWVHRSFRQEEFERFLKHIFHFITTRPSRRAEAGELARVREALYIGKLEQRIDALKKQPAYEQLEPLLEAACGGIDALVAKYKTLYAARRRSFPDGELVVGHGDPCFSNILYSKTNQHLKLIDPRGASSVDDLYTDPYYDVAKLSHSVLGGYDFINQDLFDVSVDERLGLALSLENAPPSWVAPMFKEQLKRAGFNEALTRLCEASLFISMLPLHIDRPRKVVAFAINANMILDTL